MTEPLADRIRRTLRAIPDHPKPGITFYDITPVLHDAALFRAVIGGLAVQAYRSEDRAIGFR